jgi:DnaJ-class molecular chaperone
MPARDPYHVLGVGRKAKASAVRKAHRKKAMETHPDRGGTQEAFALVQWAKDVLLDPGRRRKFDETGDADDGQPDNRASMGAGVLIQAMTEVIKVAFQHGRTAAQVPMVTAMTAYVTKLVEAEEAETKNHEKWLAAFEETGKRLTESLSGKIRHP